MTDAYSSLRPQSTLVDSPGRQSVLGSLRRPLSTAGPSLAPPLLYSASAEEKVVLDIGTHTMRAGFSGDTSPLHTCALAGSYAGRGAMGRLLAASPAGLDVAVSQMDDATLDALLLAQLRRVFGEHLLVDPRARKVVVCEGPLLPVRVKRAVARVLLGSLRVPLLTLMPAPVTALMTCGLAYGLVVDCGHRGCTAVPVYDGRPMHALLARSAMGGRALAENVRGLVAQHGRFRAFGADEGGAVDGAAVDSRVCEFITHKLLYAGDSDVVYAGDSGVGAADVRDGLSVGHVGGDMARRFGGSSAGEVRVAVAGGELLVPAWVRARAHEVLLHGDAQNDRPGLVDALVKCIAQVPVDLRRLLASHVLVVGGVADMPGFRASLLRALRERLRRDSRWRALAACVRLAGENEPGQGPDVALASGSVFRASERAWIGASLAVAAKIGGVDIRRDDFDGYNVPDWTNMV
ncbi:hypothetical protein IWW50_005715 [Coemansia erecta]|nr:hypothetical protein IWW50_005715 [Coemansia erecta]